MSIEYIQVNDINFKELVLLNKEVVLVVFSAKWCNACVSFLPILQNTINKLKNKLHLYKINVDKAVRISHEYNIKSIPTIILFNQGKVVATKIGLLSQLDIIKFLEINNIV